MSLALVMHEELEFTRQQHAGTQKGDPCTWLGHPTGEVYSEDDPDRDPAVLPCVFSCDPALPEVLPRYGLDEQDPLYPEMVKPQDHHEHVADLVVWPTDPDASNNAYEENSQKSSPVPDQETEEK